MNRRNFLAQSSKAAAAAVFPTIIPSAALGRAGTVAPSNRVALGCIGVGPQGTYVMRNFMGLDEVRVVALCDVKSNVLADRRDLVNQHYQNRDCLTFEKFEELVAREDIDACLVATTDNWHVLATLAAVRQGKDVYMEKPMGLSMEEDQMMRREVQRYGRVFQFGTQQRSDAKFRQACEIVRNGRIGPLKAIHVWSPGSSSGGSPEPVPVPSWLNYDRWLGPAPYTPYTQDRCSNRLWWFISDYALGFIAGWGIHPMDIALWGAENHLEGPWRVEGTGVFPTEGVCDTAMNWDVTIRLGGGIPVRFTGAPARKEWQERYQGCDTGHGTAFEGTEGWVQVDRSGIRASSEKLLQYRPGPNEVRLYASNHHQRNLIDCMRSRRPTVSPVESAVLADSVCHISDVAIRLQRPLTWEPDKESFREDPEANRHLQRSMRSPWHL